MRCSCVAILSYRLFMLRLQGEARVLDAPEGAAEPAPAGAAEQPPAAARALPGAQAAPRVPDRRQRHRLAAGPGQLRRPARERPRLPAARHADRLPGAARPGALSRACIAATPPTSTASPRSSRWTAATRACTCATARTSRAAAATATRCGPERRPARRQSHSLPRSKRKTFPMAIQWFPGHMHLTQKAIAERIKDIDVVIELLDARLPGSSANPMLAELTGHKPGAQGAQQAGPGRPRAHRALAGALQRAAGHPRHRPRRQPDHAGARSSIDACHELAPLRGGMAKPMRVLICGIPNVGKSTLINTLTGSRKAKTGDEAGITKLEQRITLADDFYLWDTPGMLWPRIIVAKSGYNLAASGAIGRNAFDEEEVALELLDYLKRHYAGLVEARFKLDPIDGIERRRSARSHRPQARRAAGQGPRQPAEGGRDRDARIPQRQHGPHHAGDAGGVRAVAGGRPVAGCASAGRRRRRGRARSAPTEPGSPTEAA